MNDFDIISLIKYSYMDLSLKEDYHAYAKETEILINKRVKIGESAMFISFENFPSSGGLSKKGFAKNMENIKRNNHLNKLVLIGHINNNVKKGNENGTGLVAYAFLNQEENEILFLCRGSEGGILNFVPDYVNKIKKGKISEIFNSEDWCDNFNMIYNDSRDFKPLIQFTEDIRNRYGNDLTKYKAYGHSKGGGLAIYLAGYYEKMGGVSIDGVGLPVVTLVENLQFIKRLNDSTFVNKIAQNDIVGQLLVHFEKCVYMKMVDKFENEKGVMVDPNEFYAFNLAHYPDAIYLDEEGNGQKVRRRGKLAALIRIINNLYMINILYKKLSADSKEKHRIWFEEMKIKSMKLLINTISATTDEY